MDKPPRPPPTTLPTNAALQSALESLTVAVQGVRRDVDATRGDIKSWREQLEPTVLRFSTPPPPADLLAPPPTATPVPESRPSMAVKAAQGTQKIGGRVLVILGALSFAGQLVALWKPQYAGPIAEALTLLRSLFP